MGLNDTIFSVLPGLVIIAAWVTALVFAVRMFRRGGGRPELFLLIGICLMLFVSIISTSAPFLFPVMISNFITSGADQLMVVRILGVAGIINALISLAGIVLLVLAFWKKFKAQPKPAASK